MNHCISLVVATKDRPEDLRKLLASLSSQVQKPSEIIIVDSSGEPVEPIIGEFPYLSIVYVRHLPPSAAAQRNAGIRACNPSHSLIGFADDDTTFEPNAFENMLKFWGNSSPDVLGAAFNIRNLPLRRKGILKSSTLADWVGLYSRVPGAVAPSGWQTVVGELRETRFVDWLPSGASVFRREIFTDHAFDEFFQEYSYLEDLDLSYTIGRRGRLAIVADAGFCHYASGSGRINARQFGRYEVRNRLYFVRKHNLSLARCYLGLAIRFWNSILSGLMQRNRDFLVRSFGNLEELMKDSYIPDTSSGSGQMSNK